MFLIELHLCAVKSNIVCIHALPNVPLQSCPIWYSTMCWRQVSPLSYVVPLLFSEFVSPTL